ncbi:MAG: hypothetical protein WD187_03610 [Candidatus Woykebacteria bacterium]
MLKLLPKIVPILYLFLSWPVSFVSAHEGEEETATTTITTLEDTLRTNTVKVVVVAGVIILGFVTITILLKSLGEGVKKLLFAGIVIPTLIATIYMVGSTLYLNFTSESGGPVHWHADLEIWDCGQKLDLEDPQGFSNKVGTATFHEHNDDRIHVEGVVTRKEEAALGGFFGFIGGSLTDDSYRIPTNEGLIVRHNGDTCPDGSEGTLQVFVYKTHNDSFSQEKLSEGASYILSPEGNVPPGDCIIIEFGQEKEKTEKLCNFYKLKLQTGEIKEAPGTLPPETNFEPDVDEGTSTQLNHQDEEEHGD